MIYLFLVTGLILLLLSADVLLKGAGNVARRLDIPPVITGLTIVAFGTSAPELVVSLQAATVGMPGLALGNVIGSNIANILLVLGLPALIYPTLCNTPGMRRNLLVMIATSVVLLFFCSVGVIGFWHGAFLVALLAAFLIYSGYYATTCPCEKEDQPGAQTRPASGTPFSWPKSLMLLLIGAAGLAYGASLVVDMGGQIATSLNVSDGVIGLTLVALGTSLPELTTTLMAAFRRQPALAIGNAIGSNIFNILGILGLTALVAPLPIPENFVKFDLWVMLLAALVMVPFIMTRTTLTRTVGASFVMAYGAYLYLAVKADKAWAAGAATAGTLG